MNILFQCLGITGVILIFYGLLALVITQAQNNPFFWFLMGVGSIMIVAFLFDWTRKIISQPSLLRDMLGKRSTQSSARIAVYSLILLAILGVINIQSEKFFNFKKDFTKNKVHTLADQTKKTLQSLKEDLKITAFMDDRNQEKQAVKDLLSMYESESKHVKIAFVDADKEKLLASKYGAQDGSVLIEKGMQSHLTKELNEQGITQALLKVTQSSATQLCFTKGHGELDLEGSEENERSISFVKNSLNNEGFGFESLDQIGGGVKENCSVLIIAGPQQAFSNLEAQAIDDFLSKGQKVLALLDPVLPNPKVVPRLIVLKNGLENVLSKWGVELGQNIILEQQLQLLRGWQIVPNIRAYDFGDHPIVEPFKSKNGSAVFEYARSLKKSAQFDGTAVELIHSAKGESSFSMSDVDFLVRQGKVKFLSNDMKGSIPLALAVEKNITENSKAQLVVFGDADFISNGLIQSYELNLDLFLNAVNWLAGEKENISIRPKLFEASAVELTPEQSNVIFYIVIVLIPMVILSFGMNLWWYRRKKG